MTGISATDRRADVRSAPCVSEADVGDYFALMKPRVMSLVVFTAAVGLALAPVHMHPVLAFTAILCIAAGVIYTIWLKRRTPQNIVIGGAAGAFPPMIGWAAATGSVGIESILLFLMIFFWTPPHFWALSLLRADDYARARVPMLPVVSGVQETRRQILLYSGLLIPVGAAPWLMGYAGLFYGVIALASGAAMAGLAWRLLASREAAEAARTAGRLFGFSILYLVILFAALLLDDRLASLIGHAA